MKKSTSIRTRLIGLLLLTSLGVLLVGGLSLISLKVVTDNASKQMRALVPISATTQQALLALESASSNLTVAMLAPDVEAVRVAESDFNRNMFEFDMFFHAAALGSESEAFKNLNSGLDYAEWVRYGFNQKYQTPTSTKHEQVMATMTGLVNDFVAYSQELLVLRKKEIKGTGLADELRVQQLERATSVINAKEEVGKFVQRFLADSSADLEESIYEYDRLKGILGGGVIAAIVFNLVVALGWGLYYIDRAIMRPLLKLTQVVYDISTGKLDVAIEPQVLESGDEVGKLARAFDRTIVSLKLAMKEHRDQEVK